VQIDEKTIKWVNTVLTEISKIDSELGKEMLLECGIECSKAFGLFQAAEKTRNEIEDKNNIDLLFNTFKEKHYNTPRLYKEGNTIFLEYSECYCPMVKEGVNNPFLCNCTIGYTKGVYETLFGKPVDVNLLQSVLRGDKICKQTIIIKE